MQISLSHGPVKKDALPLLLVSFIILLVMSNRLPVDARAESSCHRALLVQSRSSRNWILGLGSDLSYGNIFSLTALIFAED